MSQTFRLTLAVIAGLVVGGAVNMSLIFVSGSVIPPPAGADVNTIEGIKASIHLFEPKHFLFPFLAHFLGTLTGALVATIFTPGRIAGPAYVVGAVFLLAGIANAIMLPAPLWFSVLDLVMAYLPAAWLGYQLASSGASRSMSGV